MHALLRARMPQRAVTADTGTPEKPRRYVGNMLRALPFQTIGDIGRHGLALDVHCPTCHTTRSVSTDDPMWRNRLFATARFRCTFDRFNGHPCGSRGVPKIRPHELLIVGGPVTLAFLSCPRWIW